MLTPDGLVLESASLQDDPVSALNRTVPLILAVALFMENMDSTVIATSLPAIATDIGTSPIALKLALTPSRLAYHLHPDQFLDG